ncbi:MAG: permease [Microbacteriaceae bacterium]|nr:permease [Microbacteriaceae bacterium]
MSFQLEQDRAAGKGKPLSAARSSLEASSRLTRKRSWALAIGVIGVGTIFAVRALSPTSLGGLLPAVAQDLLTLAYSVIIESLPFVVLGIALSILVQVWIPDRFIARALPKNLILRRIAISLLGVLLPVCECGNLPLTRGLIAKGLTVSESMTFLLAAPIVNPITILTTYQAFGFSNGILVARIAGGFFVANLVGWLFSRHPQQENLLTSDFAASCRIPDAHHTSTARLRQSTRLFAREASVIMPVLFVGALVAALVQVAVPRSVLVSLGSNPLYGILAMMILAFVISVCSNVDAFFILPFASTFLPGSIVAFLIFGPIVDIKMLTMMRTTFRGSTIVQLSVVVALVSAIIGLLVNYVA